MDVHTEYRQTAMSPSPHWVLSAAGQGVSIANHRVIFRTFTPCDTFCQGFNGPRSAVKGIGEVVLEVRRTLAHPKSRHARSRTTTIVLRNVLYCPMAYFNVVSHQLFEDYKMTKDNDGTGSWKLVHNETGHLAGFLDDFGDHCTRLLLKGQKKGDARQDARRIGRLDLASEIFATWPEAEPKRWGTPRSPSNQLATCGATERWPSSLSSPVWPHPTHLESNDKKEPSIQYKEHQVEEEEVLVSGDGEETSLSDEICGEAGQQEDEVKPVGPESRKGMDVNSFARELEKELAHAADSLACVLTTRTTVARASSWSEP